jgi:hypothetical protein
MRCAFVVVLVARIAHADIAAAPPKPAVGALALERAHGPYADVRAYLEDFERVDPRGLYLFNGNEGECDHAIEGLAPAEAVGLEVKSVTIGGGNGECHLAIRQRGGLWYFLETGGAYSARSHSTIRRLSQLRRDAQRRLDAQARRLLEGMHPLVTGAGDTQLQQLLERRRNSAWWKK